jgi:hypothetical protein
MLQSRGCGPYKCLLRKAQFLFLSMYLHSAAAAQSPLNILLFIGEWQKEEKWSPLLGILAKDDETLKALSGIKSYIS